MTPFDMARRPAKQYPFLMPIVWGVSYLMTRRYQLKIEKVSMKHVKPPYLVVSTHQGFADYYIGPLVIFPHRAVYVSDMEGFAAFGKWLYRGLGCIGKRRYVPDISVIMNMRYALSKGQSVIIYPESRHANVGTTSCIPMNLGKLVKLLQVPVVTVSTKGCYLANPFWNEEKTRKVPVIVRMECIYDVVAVKEANESEIQKKLEEKLTYDEYAYQHEAGFQITDKDRAEGLHHALYQCRACGISYKMMTKGSELWCESCGAKWNLSEDGWLVLEENNKLHVSEDVEKLHIPGDESELHVSEDIKKLHIPKDENKLHIPDWYEWQRKNVIAELIKPPIFERRYNVHIEALPNEKGFVRLGSGELILNEREFVLLFNRTDEVLQYAINGGSQHTIDREPQRIVFKHSIRQSVQTEYNYRGRGPCIVLSTKDCCYYIYSDDEHFNPTEIQFVGEYLYSANLCV